MVLLQTGRGGRDRDRDRHRRDHPPRPEEKSHHGREHPPSRHLWVGNLSHNLSESTLANHFLRFGDLESVAFQPGRSYAFINFKDVDGAFAAIRHLQGYVVAGNPLRIEFTKAVSFVNLCLLFLVELLSTHRELLAEHMTVLYFSPESSFYEIHSLTHKCLLLILVHTSKFDVDLVIFHLQFSLRSLSIVEVIRIYFWD